MAMIQCPRCGESISDQAKKCIHCGLVLIEDPPKICAECGAEIGAGEVACNKCGCPVEDEKTTEEKVPKPQQVEVTGVKINSKVSKKAFAIIAVAVVVLIVAILGVQQIQKQNAVKEAEQLSAEYAENLENITYTMLSGAADAETCGNLIKSVWYNTIYEERDSKTDKYTRRNNGSGSFYDDFNDALSNLFSDSSFQNDISSIEDNQDTVATLMKDMRNPPEEWEDAYEDLQDYYDAYVELTNLATNPTGSLSTFSSSFNSADTNVINCFSKMKLYFD